MAGWFIGQTIKAGSGGLVDGSVFTGDLTHPGFIGLEDAAVVAASWRLLRERGARRVYPAHGPVRQIE